MKKEWENNLQAQQTINSNNYKKSPSATTTADPSSFVEKDSKDSMALQSSYQILSKHVPAKIDPKFIANFKRSCIIICNDFDSERNYLQNTYGSEGLRIFEQEELKIDDVHAIIQEAHIATNSDKIIAIFAQNYNHFAQNALLKVLEEPPSHIIFKIHINARNKLIPTIFSRLVVFNKSKKNHVKPLNLDIKRLTVPMVYEYVCELERDNVGYEQGRNILTQILDCMIENNIMLDEQGLQRFDLAMQALYSKQSVHIALLPLLLSFVER